ncbi:metalloregulator ArsR/SmtB family transcription factor [Crocosphaera sp. UHCC 0190]|uniref:ArsR/SmtB family transcription factor n=1 Tax=Crocosphaera sp. UHCC 0190 TaxID=3110246 RepID=UPI002B21EB0A|nr:metalloregulator ArsR/SmtB family transcription factor [Crocosphaera sp. UHCC 0190]MEA5509504.1 metalloregulator ArsR/SmtB family transcription factor [Crocosphaera sp. UHCC 0190]
MPNLTDSSLSIETTLLGNEEISKLSPTVLAMIADFFKVLSEVSRLQIVCALKSGEKNVSQIIEMTGLGQANVSKHLKLLTQAGIVTRTQEGVNVFYAIANPLVFPLCDLVCNSIATQLQQQNQHLESLKMFQQSF